MNKAEFILTIRQLIADGKTDDALVIMRANIVNFDPSLVTDITLLESRHTNVSNDFTIKGILPREDYDRTVAQINYALLEIVEKLEKSVALPTSPVKNKTSGRILHNIPGTMPVGKEKRCIVRIAYDDETLLRDLQADENTTIQDVRIAEVMNVELVDFNETPAFAIRTLNDEEQFVADDDYTQWLFMVKALREGKFPLTLKVSVIEQVNGKERKRDIVLEKEVFIISQLEEPAAAAASEVITQPELTRFEDSTIHLNYVSTETKRAATATSPATKRFTISGIASTVGLIILALTGWVTFQTFNKTPNIPVIVTDNGEKSNHNDTLSNNFDTIKGGVLFDSVNNNNPNMQPTTGEQSSHINATKPQFEKSASTQTSKPNNNNVVTQNKTGNKTNKNGTASGKIGQLPTKKPKVTKPPTKPEIEIKIDNTAITPTIGGDTSTTQPKIKIGDIKITSATEPEMKTFKVRLILKGEMKKAEIFVDGQSVDRFLKKDIWGTPQYIEFKSSKERHTITFKRGNVSCSVENIMVENGDMKVEPCSFN